MKLSQTSVLASLLTLTLVGCGKEGGEEPLPPATFYAQWVKIENDDHILITWTGLNPSNKLDYDSDMTAFRYGSSEDSYNGTIYLFRAATKADNVPTNSVVVDPKRVCSDLKNLKLKAKSKDGWVDIPVPPEPKNLDKYWRKTP